MTATKTLTDWPHLYVPGQPGAPVFLLLHGTGGDERSLRPLAVELDPDAGMLAPRGRVSEDGMNRWFRRHAEGVFDVDDVISRSADLAGFIEAAREQYGLDGRAIVAVGFSNGANIALATALLHPASLDRVVAFSGMYPLGERESSSDLTASRILMVNGDADPMAPLPSVTRAVGALRGRGAEVEQHLRPGGHGIAQADLTAAREWLSSAT
ncbi:alpha/beta hydrolase [Arthrobacter sp. M4]|uniref:alpha/beta hydrolase n=1 Tax=Arthrobacter sp. M4 TaxID=218160 RepID=UPI001CDD2CB4|nr:alpha/beta hydrolase [Arthrobacter sp. M4]MCA4134568.1 alpha/beta hydrolase [Arthrobacter sp. M4]